MAYEQLQSNEERFYNFTYVVFHIRLTSKIEVGDVKQTRRKCVSNVRKHIHFRNWVENQKEFGPSSFKIIEFIGNGSFGLVMKCSVSWTFENKIENFTVALKMVTNLYSGIDTREHANRNKNEFLILSNSALHLHPFCIVHMLGHFTGKPTNQMLNGVHQTIRDLCFKDGEIKGAVFFLVQYYEKTLESVIKNENPSQERILRYAVQIAGALLHLYECKIAHLDLKLDNIMINEMDEIVLVDFGCAAKLDASFNVISVPHHDPGNLAHLSPEVTYARSRGEKNFPCKGQYSWELGVILFEMLSGGDLPFDGNKGGLRQNWITNIPREFRALLPKLLCNSQKERMSLVDAWKYLEFLEL